MKEHKEDKIQGLTEHLFRESSGKIMAVLIRLFGLQHIETIQDALQDTFEAALLNWKYVGCPANPEGWLMQVARNKTINALKRSSKTLPLPLSSFLKKADEGSQDVSVILPHEIEDSQLRLLLTCCHPDFSERNQIILTLNILCGFGITEIAGALVMKPEAVRKALQRMKTELKEKGSVLLTPQLPRLEKRVETVQTILYLMYNEGYKTSRASEMIDHALCYEAIRLAKLLIKDGVALRPETYALLALMFFNLARFPARLTANGEIITLAEQDRSKWNTAFIEEGYYYLNKLDMPDKLNRYYLEAIIASMHCNAKTFNDTDWNTIVFLYTQLETLIDSPIVTLNKIVAGSFIGDPLIRLEELNKLKQDETLHTYYLIHAVEGDIYLRAKELSRARASFTRAHSLATSPLDKQFLLSRIAQC